jgi:hypothetical protein
LPEPSVPQNPTIYITDIVLEDKRAIFEGFDKSRTAELDMDRYRKLLVTAIRRLAYHRAMDVRICPCPSPMQATKRSNDFTSVKSLADYYMCERR